FAEGLGCSECNRQETHSGWQKRTYTTLVANGTCGHSAFSACLRSTYGTSAQGEGDEGPTDAALLHPYSRLLDDWPPLPRIGLHQRVERFRGLLLARENLQAQRGEAGLHGRVRQRLHRGRIELADHVNRCAFRREETEPRERGQRRQPHLGG